MKPRLSARERAAIRSMRSALGKIDERDPAGAIDVVLPELREVTGLEQAALVRFLPLETRVSVGRLQIVGSKVPDAELRELVASHFESSRVWGLYDPLRPEPRQRNKAMVVMASLDVLAQGARSAGSRKAVAAARLGLAQRELDRRLAAFEETERTVLRPMTWAERPQLRVLVCDGPTLLGWMGGPGAELHERQAAVLQALVPAVRRRLLLERVVEGAEIAAAGLAAALEALSAPAFVADARGIIHHANACARELLASTDLRERFVSALRAGDAAPPDLELTPLASTLRTGLFLCILRQGSPDLSVRLAEAARAWGLTPREKEVLRELVSGESNKVIAARLGCAPATVEVHVARLLEKSRCESRLALAVRFWRGR